MGTKDCSFLPFKDKQENAFGGTSNSKYSNLILNQDHRFTNAFVKPSKTFTTEKKKSFGLRTAATSKLSDFANDNYSETKKESHSWNKSTVNNLSTRLANIGFKKEEVGLKKEKALIVSTLSLHIKTYENWNEANLFDAIKEGLNKKRENTKQINWGIKGVIQYPFEFPRQQESDEATTPELAQYRVSQHLLNPNQICQAYFQQPMLQHICGQSSISLMSDPSRKAKNLQVFKFAVINASINWKSRKRCCAFMKDGKVAARCPEYKARGKKLDEVIEKIVEFRDNFGDFLPAWKEAGSFSESPIPKGYLRRNAKKFRMARPYYNQKRNEFNNLIREKPQQVRTKKYTENVKFIYHLESFHGYDALDLTSEPTALDSMLASRNVGPFSQESLRSVSRQNFQSSSNNHHQQQHPSRSNSRQQNLPPSSFQHSRPSQSNSRQLMLPPPPTSNSRMPDRSQSSRPSSSQNFIPSKFESQPLPSRSNSRQQNFPPPSSQQLRPYHSNSRQLMLPPPNRSQSSRPPSSRPLPPPSREQPNPSRSNSHQQQQQMPREQPNPSRSNSRQQQQMPPPSSYRQHSQQHQQPGRSNYRPQNIPSSRSSSQSHAISSSSRSNSSSQRPQQSRPTSFKQLALPPPVPRPPSRQQPSRQTKEIVLFESKSPAQSKRYNGPEISQVSSSSSSRPPLKPLNHNGSNSFAEQSSFNQVASILDFDDENGLLRSFYTKYHMDQFCVDDDEKDYETIEEFANSDLIEHSISNPPPNGLRLREYTKTDYKKMRLSTKKILREWKESLGPGLYDDDAPSGYEDDGEEPIETWNRLVRESKKKSRKRPYNRRSLNEGRKNEFVNASFDSVQSEPPQITIQETIQRTRIVATPGFKDLRKVGRNTTIDTSRIADIPNIKRPGSYVNSEPSPKKRRRTVKSEETPKNISTSRSSFQTPSTSRNTTIKTPSTIDIFHRLQSSGNDTESPVRRSPRVSLKAICYKE